MPAIETLSDTDRSSLLAYLGFAPKNRDNAIVGDSQVAFNYDAVAAGNVSQSTRGFSFWAQFFSTTGMRSPVNMNFGNGGWQSPDIVAQLLQPAINTGAGTITTLMGTNDRATNSGGPNATALTLDQSKAAYLTAASMILGAGRRWILIIPFPRAAPSALSGQQLNFHVGLRAWILTTFSNDPRIRIVDMWGQFALADGSLFAPTPAIGVDGLHLNINGYSIVGQAVATAFDSFFPAYSLLATSNADVWSADNPAGNLIPNGMLTGSGAASSGGATGVMPSFSVLDGGSATGWTVAGSKVTANNIEQMQIAVSGTPTTANPVFSLRQNVTSLANFAAGDTVEGLMAVEWDDNANLINMQGIFAQLTFNDGAGRNMTAGGASSITPFPLGAKKGVLITPRITLAATPTVGVLYLQGKGTQNANSAITLRTSRWMVRKVY